MNPQDVLKNPAIVLDQQQRESYFDQGYLVLPEKISSQELEPLKAAVDEMLDLSRTIAKSGDQFELETGHTAQNPRLRRVAYVDDLNEDCWSFCRNSILTDIAVDILGPNIRFRDLFINFKWAGGGAAVKWHQDIVFYPHTNVGTCQFLLALEDVSSEQGPLKVIPKSHQGPIYEHYDNDGNWTGAISDCGLVNAGIEDAVELTGGAGTLSVHHSCTIHGSGQNMSEKGRPMLVITYSAADAIPYTNAPYPSSHYGVLVRGIQPSHAHHQELNMPLPPDWSEGYYSSIYTNQDDS